MVPALTDSGDLEDQRRSLKLPGLSRLVVSRIQGVRSFGTAEAAGFHPDGKWLGTPPMSTQAVMARFYSCATRKG
jgi:hypothetical protein